MKRIILLLAAILILLATPALSQKSQNDSLRLIKLEQRLEDMQDWKDSIHSQTARESNAATETYEVSKHYMEYAEKLISHFEAWVIAILTLTGVIGTLGVFQIWKVRARREIAKQVAELVKTNTATIENIIEEKDRENSLLKECKVLVVYKNDKPPLQYFTNVISKFNTQPVNLDSLKDLSSMDKKYAEQFAAIVVYNEDDDVWDEKKNWGTFDSANSPEHLALIGFINESPIWTGILYFGRTLAQTKITEPHQRSLLSFANTPSQMFGNLLNLLDLRKRLREHHA